MHTPGEWHVNGVDTIASVKGNRTVAKVYHPEDDAKLIAAAPALLEALRGLNDYHDPSWASPELGALLSSARQVIRDAS